MSHRTTIRRLAALAAPLLPEDPHQPARVSARVSWVHETIARLKAAQQRADDAWMALVADLPEDEDKLDGEELTPPPEQAEVDALWAMVNAVVEEDRWPGHLYFGEI